MLEEVGVVFFAEFKRRIRSRAFIVGTIIGVASIALIIAIPAIVGRGLGNATKALVLAGPARLREPATRLLQRDPEVRIVDQVDRLPSPVTLAYLDAHHHASAAIVLSSARKGLAAVTYARDPGAFPTAQIGRALMPLDLALATGISARDIAPYVRNPVEVRGVESRYATEAGADLARAIAYGLIFILYFAIIFNGQAIMSAVAEEKTSRVAELLVATIPPSSLLTGKILATGAAGLIQVGLWGATSYVLAPPELRPAFGAAGGDSSGALSSPEIVAFLGFFLIGYFQYATLFAAAASLISRTEDLGSVSGPMMLPIVGAFLIAQYALVAPNATTVIVASLIPLISPFVMFTRVVITDVPPWQIVLSVFLNLAALAAIVPLAGKIYRVGMLLYGRAPKLSQIVAVLRS